MQDVLSPTTQIRILTQKKTQKTLECQLISVCDFLDMCEFHSDLLFLSILMFLMHFWDWITRRATATATGLLERLDFLVNHINNYLVVTS